MWAVDEKLIINELGPNTPQASGKARWATGEDLTWIFVY